MVTNILGECSAIIFRAEKDMHGKNGIDKKKRRAKAGAVSEPTEGHQTKTIL
jgi:hypothetical protein